MPSLVLPPDATTPSINAETEALSLESPAEGAGSGKLAVNGEDGEDGGESNAEEDGEPQPEVKKKKKRKKRKGPRKNPPPTGFEENWVDGPITKDVYDQECDIYHPNKPVRERIETCIQRYKARRKFDPIRLQILVSYLSLGGVSTGPKQFSGGLDKNDDSLDAEQIQKLTATDYVNQENEDDWEVDFEYVVRGFLSHRVPYVLAYSKVEDLENSAKVVRNFLNYIIVHNVAPEYIDSILAALKICDLAEKELILCRSVSARLPGAFNMACSTLYDGYYAGMRDEEGSTWDTSNTPLIGLTKTEARDILAAGLKKRARAFQIEMGDKMETKITEFLSLEITDIIYPEPDADDDEKEEEGCSDAKKTETKVEKPKYCKGMQALGKLLVKVWAAEGEEMPDTDLTEFELWVEKDILQFCFKNMHIDARIHTMTNGIIWFDSITAVKCSFYLQLDTPDTKDSDPLDEFE